jgi:hypothetical protein
MVPMISCDGDMIDMISGMFESYRLGSISEVLPLKESAQYQQDFIGLRTLDEVAPIHLLTQYLLATSIMMLSMNRVVDC